MTFEIYECDMFCQFLAQSRRMLKICPHSAPVCSETRMADLAIYMLCTSCFIPSYCSFMCRDVYIELHICNMNDVYNM